MTGYVGAQWLNELDVTLGPGVVCTTYHKSWTACGLTLLCSVSPGSLINEGDNVHVHVHHMYTWTYVGVLRLNVWMKIVLRYASRQVQKGSFDPSSFMICIQEGIGRRQTCIAKIALSSLSEQSQISFPKRGHQPIEFSVQWKGSQETEQESRCSSPSSSKWYSGKQQWPLWQVHFVTGWLQSISTRSACNIYILLWYKPAFSSFGSIF